MSWDVYVGMRVRQPRTPLASLASLGNQPWFKVEVLHRDYLRRAELSRSAAEGTALPPAVFDELRQLTKDAEPAAEGWLERRRFELDADARVVELAYRGILRCLTPGYRWPAIGESGYDAVYDAGDYKHYSPSLRGAAAERNVALLVRECAELSFELGVRELRGLDAERSADPGDAWLVYHSNPEGYGADLHRLGLAAPPLESEAILEAALRDDSITFEQADSGPIIYSKLGSRGRLQAFYRNLARAHGAA
jgi:hypothetical protein